MDLNRSAATLRRMTPRERMADARLYLVCDARPRAFLRRRAARAAPTSIQLRDKTLDDDGPDRGRDGVPRRRRRARRAVHPQRPPRPRRGVRRRRRPRRPGRRRRRRAARAAVGPDRIVGRSTHAPAQADAADADPDVDYLAVGPVHATPTKPGRPAAGLDYVAYAARTRASRGSRSAASTRNAAGRGRRARRAPRRRRARDHRRRRPRGRRARAARRCWRWPLGQRSRKRRALGPPSRPRRPAAYAAATRARRARTTPPARRSSRCARRAPARGHDRRGPARSPSPPRTSSSTTPAGRSAARTPSAGGTWVFCADHARRRDRDVARQYWAVLGFEMLLGIALVGTRRRAAASRRTSRPSRCASAIFAVCGPLFWFLIRAMARHADADAHR